MSYGGYGGQGGYGGPQGGYGGQQGGYGQQQHQQGGYGGQGGGYGPPPSGGGGYGSPPPPGGGYGSPPPQQHQGGGYGQHQGGYGHGPPPPQGGYGQPPQQGAGGYGQQQKPRPPSGSRGDPQLLSWFRAVDRDRSGKIDAVELQQALVNGDWTPFDIDTVKMLIDLFDADRSGTIEFGEFEGVWKYVREWQGVFRRFDTDSSGTIAGPELANAMRQFNYNLNPHILKLLEHKYGGFVTSRNRDGGITFDRFVRCCVVVKNLTEAFQRADTDRDGWVQMSYHQFLEIVLAAP